MKTVFLFIAALIFAYSVASAAQAQVSCVTIGQNVHCDNGQDFNRIGQNWFDNTGQTWTRIGNSTFTEGQPRSDFLRGAPITGPDAIPLLEGQSDPFRFTRGLDQGD